MQLICGNIIGDSICLEFDNNDTLDNIRDKIKGMGYLVSSCYIRWRSPQLFVLTATEKTIYLGYNCSDTISDLKLKISFTECILPEDQILFFAGKALEDSSPISRYNISQGSFLNLVDVSGRFIRISVVTGTGKPISMNVNRHFSARRVKNLLKEQIGDLDGMRLVNVYAGEEFLDRQTLYLFENDSRLHLVDDAWMVLKFEMKLFVKIFPAQRTIELDVVNRDTISHVKHMIEEKEKIPVRQQVLYLPHKRLDDKFTLAHYYIFDKSTLCLVESSEYQRP